MTELGRGPVNSAEVAKFLGKTTNNARSSAQFI